MTGPAQRHLELIDAATGRLLDTLAGLTDAQARQPSSLPGWSRGHLITHVARNADGMCNLLHWARTGEPRPMYREPDGRAADIEAGSGRPAAELARDVADSRSSLAPGRAGTVRAGLADRGPAPAGAAAGATRSTCWTAGCWRWSSTTSTWTWATGSPTHRPR